MIAAILVVPLVYFINAFLIGRLIKRFNISINPFLATLVGFVALFDVIYIFTVWMYAGKAAIWSYFVVVGVIQCILLALYLANWRYVFLTWSIDYKKIITFALAFVLTILIGWLNFRQYNSEFGKNWIWVIDNAKTNIWSNMWFGSAEGDIVSNFYVANAISKYDETMAELAKVKEDYIDALYEDSLTSQYIGEKMAKLREENEGNIYDIGRFNDDINYRKYHMFHYWNCKLVSFFQHQLHNIINFQ